MTTPRPEIWLDLKDDTIDNAADARQLGQWLIEAADVLDRINDGPRGQRECQTSRARSAEPQPKRNDHEHNDHYH